MPNSNDRPKETPGLAQGSCSKGRLICFSKDLQFINKSGDEILDMKKVRAGQLSPFFSFNDEAGEEKGFALRVQVPDDDGNIIVHVQDEPDKKRLFLFHVKEQALPLNLADQGKSDDDLLKPE